jgi:hypothetical protein
MMKKYAIVLIIVLAALAKGYQNYQSYPKTPSRATIKESKEAALSFKSTHLSKLTCTTSYELSRNIRKKDKWPMRGKYS